MAPYTNRCIYVRAPFTPGAQHAAAGAAPVPPAHSQHGKKGSGPKTFLIAFAGALAACLVVFGVAGALSMFGGGDLESHSTESLGAQTSTEIKVDESSASLAEAVAAKCLPSVAAVDVYARNAQMDDLYSSTARRLRVLTSCSNRAWARAWCCPTTATS